MNRTILLLFLLTTGFVFNGCQKDDPYVQINHNDDNDDDNNNDNNTCLLGGVWVITHVINEYGCLSHATDPDLLYEYYGPCDQFEFWTGLFDMVGMPIYVEAAMAFEFLEDGVLIVSVVDIYEGQVILQDEGEWSMTGCNEGDQLIITNVSAFEPGTWTIEAIETSVGIQINNGSDFVTAIFSDADIRNGSTKIFEKIKK